MQIHLNHPIGENARLVLEESDGVFNVTFLTKERISYDDEPPKYGWFANNTQSFTDYNQALACFRKRRDSDNPYLEFTIDWDAISIDIMKTSVYD